jgi:menaquinone-dependent protoporphyrinogen IX oxidase
VSKQLEPLDPGEPGSFKRRMVIQRVRNPQDDSQWVDIAITTAIIITRKRSDKTDPARNEQRAHHYNHDTQRHYQRRVIKFRAMQIGKEKDRSEEFEVTSNDDLEQAAKDFADAHPD